MPNAVQQLPDHYREICRVDLEKNKKQMIVVNVLSVLLIVPLVPFMLLLAPENAVFLQELQAVAVIAGMLVYILLHEAVHGVCFWLYSRRKPHFGWKSVYAYAASDAYYRKMPYLIIALAPVALWGIVLAALAAILPPDWYWTIQLIQLANISGAAGDLYVTWLFMHMPADILVQDAGISMQVYAPEKE